MLGTPDKRSYCFEGKIAFSIYPGNYHFEISVDGRLRGNPVKIEKGDFRQIEFLIDRKKSNAEYTSFRFYPPLGDAAYEGSMTTLLETGKKKVDINVSGYWHTSNRETKVPVNYDTSVDITLHRPIPYGLKAIYEPEADAIKFSWQYSCGGGFEDVLYEFIIMSRMKGQDWNKYSSTVLEIEKGSGIHTGSMSEKLPNGYYDRDIEYAVQLIPRYRRYLSNEELMSPPVALNIARVKQSDLTADTSQPGKIILDWNYENPLGALWHWRVYRKANVSEEWELLSQDLPVEKGLNLQGRAILPLDQEMAGEWTYAVCADNLDNFQTEPQDEIHSIRTTVVIEPPAKEPEIVEPSPEVTTPDEDPENSKTDTKQGYVSWVVLVLVVVVVVLAGGVFLFLRRRNKRQ